jgi:hypothetical protein
MEPRSQIAIKPHTEGLSRVTLLHEALGDLRLNLNLSLGGSVEFRVSVIVVPTRLVSITVYSVLADQNGVARGHGSIPDG